MASADTLVHEFSTLLLTEKCLLISSFTSLTAYGVHLTLFLQCFRLLLRDRTRKRSTYLLMAFISSGFILGTLYAASISVITQYTFINYAHIPGGPIAFYLSDNKRPLQLLGTFSAIIGTWLADGLLLWRGFVIYRGSGAVLFIMVLPALVFLGSVAMSICLLIQILHPNIGLGSDLNFELPYTTLTLSLNIIIAILISTRLLSQRRRITNALGAQYAYQYTSVTAMIVESAALDSAFVIPYLVLYAINHPAQVILLQSLSQIEFIAALLIIYRVAYGRAWSSETTTTILSRTAAPLKLPVKRSSSTLDTSSSTRRNPSSDDDAMSKIEFRVDSENRTLGNSLSVEALAV